MLLEAIDTKSDIEESREDLADAMVPRVDRWARKGPLTCVGHGFFERLWSISLEVGELDPELIALPLPIEAPHHRVTLTHVERTTGLRERRHGLRPPPDVRQPTDGAHTRVDDIELLVENAWRRVDVRLDEPCIDTHSSCQVGCRGDRAA